MNTLHAVGIDIAKKKFDVAFSYNDKIRHLVCPNNKAGFNKLIQHLKKLGITTFHACMEATSHYGDALALFLFDSGFTVSVVNPAQIKAFANSQLTRNKTDKADAVIIARYCEQMTPKPWRPDPKHVQELQALVRRLDALNDLLNQENNRLENANKTIKRSIKAVIKTIEKEIKTVKKLIEQHIDKNPDLKEKSDLLDSITGIGPVAISQILAFLGDISSFKSAKQVVAFLGLNPKQYTSGSSVRGKTRISKVGDSALRKVFYFPALVAKQHNPLIKTFCDRLIQNGKKGKVVICAAMRKLVHIVFGVLKSGKPFDPNFLAVNV
jgi:transposase